MPRNKEIEKISNDISAQAKNLSLKDGLSEIYQDDQGRLVDVSRLTIKKGLRGWLKLLLAVVALTLLIGGGYWLWLRFNLAGDITKVNLSLEGDKAPRAGQESEYLLKIINDSGLPLSQATVSVTFPEGFVFSGAEPAPSINNNVWQFNELAAKGTKEIRLRGKTYNLVGKSNLWSAELLYRAAGLSSEFRKNSVLETVVADSGLAVQLISPSSVLKSADQEIIVKYRQANQSGIDNFRLTIEPSDAAQLEFLRESLPNEQVVLERPWVWQASRVTDEEKEIRVRFRFLDKVADKLTFKFKFDYLLPTSSATSSEAAVATPAYVTLVEQAAEMSVIKNDLSLLLTLNDQPSDTAVDFGQTLRYAIAYHNVGDSPMEDVVITAILEGDLLDRNSLIDRQKGELSGQTITWSKLQIPELARVDKGEKGLIPFSIKVKNLQDLTGNFAQEIKAAARFEMKRPGDVASIVETIKKRDEEALAKDLGLTVAAATTSTADNNYSNRLLAKINSDLNLTTSIRYFSQDNVPLGSGPLPLEVGKTTALRAVWRLTNSLHNLSSVKAIVVLPEYIMPADWRASVGQMNYDDSSRQLTWELSAMDRLLGEATAELTIKITPTEAQRDQLLILMPAVKLTAVDDYNAANIVRESRPKTSKLEDDEVAAGTGIDLNGGLVK